MEGQNFIPVVELDNVSMKVLEYKNLVYNCEVFYGAEWSRGLLRAELNYMAAKLNLRFYQRIENAIALSN